MSKGFVLACVACAGLAAGCRQPVDVEKIPAGSEVQLTRQDGGLVHGELRRTDRDYVVMAVGQREQEVRRTDIVDLEVIDESKAPTPIPRKARFNAIEIPGNTRVMVSTDMAMASDTSRVEDPIEAHLIEPVVVDGVIALPTGSRLRGTVSSARPSGKVKGRAFLAIRFTSLDVAEHGTQYPIDVTVSREAAATKGEDAKKIAFPAAGGAIIGGLFGGKKGAVIGGVVGGGAGTAVVLTTAGNEVRLPRGTTMTLRIAQPIEAHVPIDRRSSTQAPPR